MNTRIILINPDDDTLANIDASVTDLTIRYTGKTANDTNDFEWVLPLVRLEKLRVENWNGYKYKQLLLLPALHTLELPDAKISPYIFSFSDSLTRVELKSFIVTFSL